MNILSRTITTELDNGIRLCYFHRPGASVEFQFHVSTGSIHEGKFLGCGLSHFLEHMAFQGCAGFPERTIAETVNTLGGDVNAYTSYDRTCYTMQLPKEHWKRAVDMLSAMVRFPEFPETRFLAEKEVILRECEKGNDDPERRLHERFLRTMFRNHPARYPVIGFPEMISRVTRDMMREYHQSNYTPERCVLVAVGDLDVTEFFAAVGEKLGDWQRSNLAPQVFPDDPLPISTRQSELIFPDSVERIFWGVRGPWFSSAETPALDLLFGVLGTGDGSILNRSLVFDKQLALGVSSFCYSLCGTTIAGVSGKCEPGKMTKFTSALLRELEQAAAGKIPQGNVEREKGQLYADHLRSLRKPASIAGEIAGGMIYDNSPQAGDVYLENLQRTGMDELRAVAGKYLDIAHWTCVSQRNKPQTVKKVEITKVMPVEKTLSPAGIQLFHVPDKQLPLCSFFMAFSGGVLHEPVGKCGISRLLAAAFTAGTRKYSEEKFLEKLDECGVELNVSGGANSITLEFSAPKCKMNRAVGLICELLREPRLEAGAVEREKIRCLERIKERALNPVSSALDRVLQLLYGDHPYAFTRVGRAEDIAMLDREQLLNFYRDCCAGSIVAGFGGDCSKGEVQKWGRMLDDAMTGKGGTPLTRPELPVFSSEITSDRYALARKQTVVVRMLPGIANNDPDIDLVDILHLAENGLASNLFKTVREEHALSYSVGMSFSIGFHPGTFCFYAMTAAGAENEVMQLLDEEINRLARSGLSVEEFEAAKSGVLFDLARMFDSVDGLLRTAVMDGYYGLSLDDLLNRQARIRALDAAEFNRRIRGYFTDPAGVKLTVVPLEKN